MSTTTTTPLTTELRDAALAALERLGADVPAGTGLPVVSPLSGQPLLELRRDGTAEAEAAVGRAAEAFRTWRSVPAPCAARWSSAWASCSPSTRRTWPSS
nr:hypothetical protein GCM10025730_47230 [Promicromonospora thailandica]